MTTDESTSTPESDEDAYLAFLKDLDAAADPEKLVEEYAGRYPHLVDELRAMAGMRRALDRSSQPEEDAEPPPDRLGDFRIVRRIAHGGMGEIYEAIQEPLNRRVAVKIIRGRHRHLTGPPQRRFLREQNVLAQLHHTHIVPIHSAGGEGRFSISRCRTSMAPPCTTWSARPSSTSGPAHLATLLHRHSPFWRRRLNRA